VSNNTPPHSQIRWHCRRGMLELDLILIDFFDQHYAGLTASQQQVFVRLLDCHDPDLLAWLLGKSLPEDKELAAIVQYITATA